MAALARFYALFLLFLSSTLAELNFTFDDDEFDLEPRARFPCTDGVHIIGVRGHGREPPPPYGNLTSTVVGLLKRIPQSTNDSVHYPLTAPPPPNQVGGTRLTNKIEKFAAKCPDTPIVLLGYSQGAIIVMNTICGGTPNTGTDNPPLSPDYLAQIIAIGVYGDESRTYGQPYDRGTCKTYGSYPRENPQGCDPYANVIRSYCDAPDPLCCAGGTNRNDHSIYPSKYNKDLWKFIVTKYDSYQTRKQSGRKL